VVSAELQPVREFAEKIFEPSKDPRPIKTMPTDFIDLLGETD
jgi:hypothetical protein